MDTELATTREHYGKCRQKHNAVNDVFLDQPEAEVRITDPGPDPGRFI